MAAMEYVTEKDCIAVMEEALKGRSFDITNYKLQPFSDIMGFHGSHAFLMITAKVGGKSKEYKFFVKLATKNQIVFDRYFGRMNLFLKEHIMITKLVKELQNQIKKRLTSECYLSRLNKFMVLENLNDISYEIIRRKEGMDILHSKIAVQTFADFHAASILLTENGTSIPEKYPDLAKESLFFWPDDDTPEICLINSCHKGVSKWAEKNTPEIPSNIIEEAFPKVLERTVELVKPSKKFRNVSCHGDPWGNNIMYKYVNDVPIDGILVDFQATRFAPPAIEITQFLYVALSQDEREKHESVLLETYYERLGQTLSAHGVEVSSVLPRPEFEASVRHYREFGICARLYYTYITKIPASYLAPAVSDVHAFLGLMVEGDPTIPLAAAQDPGYSAELKSAIDDVVRFYTGHRVTRPLL